MSVTVQCPNCFANLKMKSAPTGKRVRCPKCEEPFVPEVDDGDDFNDYEEPPRPKKRRKSDGRRGSKLKQGDDVGERKVVVCTDDELHLKGSLIIALLFIIGGGLLLAFGIWLSYEVIAVLAGWKGADMRIRGRTIYGLLACLGFGGSGLFIGMYALVVDIVDGSRKTYLRSRLFGLWKKTWTADEFSGVVVRIEKPEEDDDDDDDEDAKHWAAIVLTDRDGEEALQLGHAEVNEAATANCVHAAIRIGELLGLPVSVEGEVPDDAAEEFVAALELVE